MARISVEQKALTDPRFHRLGHDLGAEIECAQALGLLVMIRVWNECIERGAYILDGWLLQAIAGKTDGADLMVAADLAVALKGNRFRIKGTKGRIEYLEEKRKLARENGKKGGRPRKPTSVSVETNVGVPGETPPAPAPAQVLSGVSSPPVLSEPTETPSTGVEERVAVPRKPRNGTARPSPLVKSERLQELQAQFDRLYEYFPRHTGKDMAWRAFVKLDPDAAMLREIALSVKKRVDAGSWAPNDPERARFIPHLSTFLNQRRWLDEDVT